MATHQLVFLASGIVGFGPAIAVLYHALRTYDYPFTDRSFFDTRRVFLGLAVGMVLGTISGAFTVGARFGIASLLDLVIVLILVSLFEEAFKLIYLNRKGYRGRFDTTFYGLSLGVGIAAIASAGNAYTNGPGLFAPAVFLPLLVFSISLALVHGATGAILGYGCSKGDVVVAFAQALVGRVLHAALLLPFFLWFSTPQIPVVVPIFSLAAAIAFTFFLYAYAYRTLLPNTLPAEMRRERRRRSRRAAARE